LAGTSCGFAFGTARLANSLEDGLVANSGQATMFSQLVIVNGIDHQTGEP